MSQPQEQLLPRRVLVVDDDELVRETIAASLREAGFEVAEAPDGEVALTMLGRRWFPVVVTDRVMPVLDGIDFVTRLRAISISPIYVIMLTSMSDSQEFERGYCAGVDLYVAKNGHDREVPAKVTAAFSAVRRRQAIQTGSADRPVTVDLESGAHTARHLVGRLHTEMSYAARHQRSLHVMSICINPEHGSSQHRSGALEYASDALLDAVHSSVRERMDWIARLPASRDACRLSIVMPDADAAQIAAVEQGVRNAFVASADEPALRGYQITFGTSALADLGDSPTALGLLAEAERQRRGARAKPAAADSDVGNVQERAA